LEFTSECVKFVIDFGLEIDADIPFLRHWCSLQNALQDKIFNY